MKHKVVVGDDVVVLSGSEKGLVGKVIRAVGIVSRGVKRRGFVVSGINVHKKHKKPSRGRAGMIVDLELPIDASNVALLIPGTKSSFSRVGFKLQDGKKVRFLKRSGHVIV